ncbi:MAG TPA: hypothetical protein VHY84_01685 [Bryobacteraceae bacterium]|jgi:hypothetical protein|nr:hypothetical protein [Bryobacteraceae bacterium]
MSAVEAAVVHRFRALFDGLNRVYGTYEVPTGTRQDGKLTGKAVTLAAPVTDALWSAHLAGTSSLGIVPIRDDGTVRFGAIDIDVYADFDPAHIAARLIREGLPMVTCRSKSGGAHVYLFTSKAVPAHLMRERLRSIAVLLGHGKAEVFPKQSKLAENDFGCWLNMPYFDREATTRFGVRPDGEALTVEQFLDLAEGSRVDASWFSPPLPGAQGPTPQGKARERVPVERLLSKAIKQVRGGEGRNIAGLWLFCQLRDAGYDRDEASLSLREWVRAANEVTAGQDKYTMREAEATLRSAYKREAREPWDTDGKESQADILLAMTEDFEYFKSGPANEGYVRVAIGDHSEVWPAGNGKGAASSKVREILTHRFLEKYARAPGREALNAVGDTVVAKCSMGPKVDVHVRFARTRDVIYLDMCDDRWRAIEVDASGWRVVERPAVLFKRHSGARALPVPVAAGTLEDLRPLLNSGDESQWLLMVAWLAGAFLPEGAFAHLVLEGEQGSAKSTTARILQSLLDPSDAGLSSPPKDETDATVSALNAGILAYDNLSGCRAEMADIFCRFSTGQGYRTRTLYETLGITVAAVKLPILLNGIDSTVMRGDLLERSITLKLPRIPTQNRRTEQGIWADFAGMHAGVLGALLDAVSCGLRNLPNTTVPDAPRMSDFCTWVAACEPALPWKPGQFLAAYRGRMEEANRDLADNDPVASALVDWAEQWLKPGSVVQMVAKDLLIALNEVTSDCPKDMRRWPPDAQSLAFRLVRLAPVLKAQGIEVRRLKRTKKERSRWEIRRPGPQSLLLPRFVEDGSEVEDEAA